MKQVNNSYFQDQKQGVEGARYVPIKPALVGEIFQSHGFDLVDFKSGTARKMEFQDHQKTITRFRHKEAADGAQNEITLIAPHLGRGVLQLILGTYRLVCLNGLVVGQAFGIYNVKHIGNVANNLDTAIAALLVQETTMKNQIEKMKQITLNPQEQIGIAMHLAAIRLKDANAILESVRPYDLVKVRRDADADNSLWTVFNRIQEAIMRHGFAYQQIRNIEVAPNVFQDKIMNMTARALHPLSVKGVAINQELWTEATKLIGAEV